MAVLFTSFDFNDRNAVLFTTFGFHFANQQGNILWAYFVGQSFSQAHEIDINTNLSTRALFGKTCSKDDVPFTRNDKTGGDELFESMEIILAGKDIVMSPVTRIMQLNKKRKSGFF